MNKEANSPIKSFSFVIIGLLLIIINGKSFLSSKGNQLISIPIPSTPTGENDSPTSTPVNTKPVPTRSTRTNTPSPTATPTLISGVLTCNTVVAGVTCTNNGSYLDYNININVTGLTGGATAGDITIGTYKRSTSGGYMGMMSNFVHSETSGDSRNTVFSSVVIHPFDAGGAVYTGFTSVAGTNVSVTNKTADWRYIGGSGGWPNTLSVGGNVDYSITGYSIVGHIYLYSNQSFVTGTPTPTRTSTATATATFTSTPITTPTLPTFYTGNARYAAYGVKAVISAPAQAPYLVDITINGGQYSGESNWVSIPKYPANPYWVQAGWRYYYGWSLPKRYIEHYDSISGHQIVSHGTQAWGTAVEYKVEWQGGNTWCAFVPGVAYECYDVKAAPEMVLARSEVHASPLNELDVNFISVSYLDVNNQWLSFDQWHWLEQAPYIVTKWQLYQFHNYGP